MIITTVMLLVSEIVIGLVAFTTMCCNRAHYIFIFLDIFDISNLLAISALMVETLNVITYDVILVKMGLPVLETIFGILFGAVVTFSWNCLILSKISRKYRIKLCKNNKRKRGEDTCEPLL